MTWSFEASVEAACRAHRREKLMLSCFAERLGVQESKELVELMAELDDVRAGAEGRGESAVISDLRELAQRRGA